MIFSSDDDESNDSDVHICAGDNKIILVMLLVMNNMQFIAKNRSESQRIATDLRNNNIFPDAMSRNGVCLRLIRPGHEIPGCNLQKWYFSSF